MPALGCRQGSDSRAVAGRDQESVPGGRVLERSFSRLSGHARCADAGSIHPGGAWLVRDLEDFAHSIIILKQAKTIKYDKFVEPGRQLELRVELTSYDERDCMFKGVGVMDGHEMVKGRFTLTRYNLRDKNTELHATDSSIVAGLRDLYSTLRKGSVGAKAIARRPEAVDSVHLCRTSHGCEEVSR